MYSFKHDRYYELGKVKRNEALECLSKAIAKKGVFKHLGDEADTGRVSSRYWVLLRLEIRSVRLMIKHHFNTF